MAKYITVLNSDLDNSFWKAIQLDDVLNSIKNNKYYSLDYNMNIPKEDSHELLDTKVVIEIKTLISNTATIIKLSKETTNVLKLINNEASKSY